MRRRGDNVNTIEKTVNEMIDQLQDLKQRLYQLNIEEPVDKLSNTGSILLKARQSPFFEHPLVRHDTHTQNLYLTMLVSTLYYDSECIEERTLYIAKIYEALNCEQSFETYFVRAKTITLEDLRDFFITMQKQNLRKLIILEVLLLLGVHQTKELSAYIVELASSLQLTEYEFSLLCKMAKYIVGNNKSSLDHLIEQNLEERLLCPHLFRQVGSTFIPLIFKGTHISVFAQEDFKNRISIDLENVILKSEGELVFQNLTELKLINCQFNQEAIKITIKNCENVYIDGMDLSNHEEVHWIKFQGCSKVIIKNINITRSVIQTDELFKFTDIDRLEVDILQAKDIRFYHHNPYIILGKKISSEPKVLACSNVKQSILREAIFSQGLIGIRSGIKNSSINKLQENINCIFE